MKQPGGFTRVPNALLAAPLSAAAKVVCMELFKYRDLGGDVTPKLQTLAATLKLPLMNVRRSLAELRNAGLITWKRGRRFNSYTIAQDFHRRLLECSRGTFTSVHCEHSQPPYLLIESEDTESGKAAAISTASSSGRKPPKKAAAAAKNPDAKRAVVGLPLPRFSNGHDRRRNGMVVDFSPHTPASVATVRDSLGQLAREIALPAPDDAIVQQVLDAGRGADGAAIHKALVGLFRRGKFKNVQSWGFLPVVLKSCFVK